MKVRINLTIDVTDRQRRMIALGERSDSDDLAGSAACKAFLLKGAALGANALLEDLEAVITGALAKMPNHPPAIQSGGGHISITLDEEENPCQIAFAPPPSPPPWP